MQLEFAGFELGHVGGFFDEMIQAVALFVDDGEKFAVLRRLRGGGTEQIGYAGLDGREWGAEIVGDGIEERGFESLALAFGFSFAELLDGAGAFNGDGYERADGIQRLPRQTHAGNAEAADRFDAKAHGKKMKGAGRIGNCFIANEGGLHLLLVDL